ncbi:MAG: DMT family transporter [Alphaproteobacteria bacterium]|nr:DMT family transporter [Alphaproteobacteria bacterium]
MPGWIAYVACLIGVFGHASSEFVAKVAATPGPEFSVWRFLIGGACLVVVTQFWPGARDLITPLKENGLRILLLSCLGMALGQLIFHWALDFASVVQVATIVTGIPIAVVVVDRLINGTPMTAPKVVSGIGAFIGVVLLLTNGATADVQFGGPNLIGTLMALICAVIGGVYIVMARPMIQAYGPVRITAYTFALGFFFLYVVVGLAWGVWVDPTSLFDKRPEQIAGILTIGIWNTAMAMTLWLAGMTFAPDPQRANYLFFLKPVIAAFLAVLILGDQLTWMQGLAIFAICFCVALEYVWTQSLKTREQRA